MPNRGVSTITHLECSACKKTFPHDQLQNVCSACGKPLLARYDLKKAARSLTRAALTKRAPNMWRYLEVLPGNAPVTLGEGMTPLLRARRAGERIGLKNLYVKDEGLNPTGSFKARGLAAAVTQAKALGARTLAIPTAGNAGGALAAYAAKAGIPAVIVMPADTPLANVMECRAFGADVRKIDGLISDCGKYVAERKEREGWFEVSTLKEPYRIEGKKTMSYELWEQFEGSLPDVIIYPTGGGVGLIGMWKAFDEMEELGWVGKKRPKMIVVQSAGCAPIPKAWDEGKPVSEAWQNAATVAAGLRVPKAYGDYIILDILKKSGGTAIAVSDDELMHALTDWARDEGVFAAPEGAASLAAYRKLIASGFLKPSDVVVLFNTGSGLKYIDVIAAYSKRAANAKGERAIGGIITPY